MQQKFLVQGVAVFTRRLPSGDLAVWHPFNAEVQAIVEPLCRGRGYWQAEFNNWIVKAHCVALVSAELAKIGSAP